MYRQVNVSNITLDDRMRERARIVETQDSEVLRTLLAFGVRTPTGFYSSMRTGYYQPWKQPLERLRFWICETDPAIRSYRALPHRIHVPVDGEHKAIFLADLRIDYRNGAVGVETIVDRRPPPSARVLDFVRDLYQGMGWSFRVVRKRHVEGGHALDNARLVERDKDTKITTTTLRHVRDFVAANGGEVAYARLVESLGNPTVGRALLHALIVRGHLDFDIEARLTSNSPIRLIGYGGGDLP